MLVSSFVKQPWYFDKLMDAYISTTYAISTKHFTAANPMTITQFNTTNYDLRTIFENCVHKVLTLRNLTSVERVCANNVRLFIYVLPIANRDLLTKIWNSVLCAFYAGFRMTVKTLCIEFMTQLWQQKPFAFAIGEFDEAQKLMLDNIQFVYEKANRWLEMEYATIDELHTFFCCTVSQYIEVSLTIPIQCDTVRSELIDISMKIIQSIRPDTIPDIDTFISGVRKFLQNLLSAHNPIHSSIDQLLAMPLAYDEIVPLLKPTILEEIQNDQKGTSLKYFNNIIQKNLIDLRNSQTVEIFVCQLNILKCALHLAGNTEHSFRLWHQKLHLATKFDQDNCTVCNRSTVANCIQIQSLNLEIKVISIELIEDFETFINSFMEIVKSAKHLNSDTCYKIAEIAGLLLGLDKCETIPDTIQLELLQLALSVFPSDDSQDQFKTLFEPHRDVDTDSTKTTNQLNSLLVLNFAGFKMQTKSYFVQRFYASIYSKMTSANWSTIAKLTKNFIITNFDQFENNYFEPFLTIDDNDMPPPRQQAVAWLTKFLVCFTSNECCAEIRQNDIRIYRVMCSDCNGHTMTNGLVEKGIILSYQANICVNQLSDNSLKLFKSPSADCRLTMVQCLLAITVHYTSIVCTETASAIWAATLLDECLDVQMALANVLDNICDRIVNAIDIDFETKRAVYRLCLVNMQINMKKCLETRLPKEQSCCLKMIGKLGGTINIPERVVLHCFRFCCAYMLSPESAVARAAVLCAQDMCKMHNFTPSDMCNWYVDDTFKYIIAKTVDTFLRYTCNIEQCFAIVSFEFMAVSNVITDFPILFQSNTDQHIVRYEMHTGLCLE